MKTLHISYSDYRTPLVSREIARAMKYIEDPDLVVHIKGVPVTGAGQRDHPFSETKPKHAKIDRR